MSVRKIIALFSLGLFISVGSAQAGFSIKNVLKNKGGGGSSSGSSGGSPSLGGGGSGWDWSVENRDDVAADIEYHCAGPGESYVKSKKGEKIGPGETKSFKGSDWCEWSVKTVTGYGGGANSRSGRTPQGQEKWIVHYGKVVRDSEYDNQIAQHKHQYAANFYSTKIIKWAWNTHDNFRDKPLSTAQSLIKKKLGKGHAYTDKFKTTWIVKKKEFGDNCVRVRTQNYPKSGKLHVGGFGTDVNNTTACQAK